MLRRPPRATRTDTLFPYTTLFRSKAGVVHSEILAPEGAPERLNDRATLWNEVEAGEKRKDAQLAREVEFSIPRELNQQQGIQLARDLAKRRSADGAWLRPLMEGPKSGVEGKGGSVRCHPGGRRAHTKKHTNQLTT